MKPSGDHMISPDLMWAQRKDVVYVTVNLDDCKDPLIEITENELHFKGVGGTDKVEHECRIELFAKVDPKESKYAVQARNIPIVLRKQTEDSKFWPRLTREKLRANWLHTDWNKWKDEDDSDYDAADPNDFNMEDMMQGMGGGMPPMDFGNDAPDSDDDSLPDLENADEDKDEKKESAKNEAAADVD